MSEIIKYVSVDEMVAIEKEADASGHSYAQMMEHAGLGLAEAIIDYYNHLADEGIIGLVGSGNNGGDTLVALAQLAELGWRASAYIVRPRPSDDPLVERLYQAGGKVYKIEDDTGFQRLDRLLTQNAVFMDGVLGTGIRLPLKGEVAEVLDFTRHVLEEKDEAYIVSVDCPSGVDCDTGDRAEECIPADVTVTMAAIKRGLLMFPAAELVGEIHLVGIGLGELDTYPQAWHQVKRFVPHREWVGQNLPARPLFSYKGTFGTALVVAGSIKYTGAALLAGEAAYRIGAGLVTLAVPRPLHTSLAGLFPEATWLPLSHEQVVIATEAAEEVSDNLERVTAILLGPGFGLNETTFAFLERLLSMDGGRLPPAVIDADGLKLLAGMDDWHMRLDTPAVLTPHPGEMSVLTGLSTEMIQANRVEIAERFAREWGHVLVLKGAFTVIAGPDGNTAVIPIASPGLARAGTGDVLAGIIVGLRAQGMDAFMAAVAGAWIHAEAGLHAVDTLGSSASVLAGDVLMGVIDVLADLEQAIETPLKKN
jgi:NAD(P)H-hydrate epimerase